MNKKLFLFDTNIYRRLAEIVKENRYQGNNFIIAEIKDKEDHRSCQSILSFTTTQELLVHLKDGDAGYEECRVALQFQFCHTQIFQKRKLIPSIDSLLAYFFYNSDSKDDRLNFTNIIYKLICKIGHQIEDLSKLKSEIANISYDFLDYKREFYLLFKSLLSHPDNIDNNWNFFVKDKKLNEFIESEAYIDFIVNYLIERTNFFCKNQEQSNIDKVKIYEFKTYFREALLHFRYLFDVLYQSGEALMDLNNAPWNAIRDFHLVFEWCFLKYFHKEKQVDIILVTEDKSKNFKGFKDRNVDCWDIEDYLEFLGFRVRKSSSSSKKFLLVS